MKTVPKVLRFRSEHMRGAHTKNERIPYCGSRNGVGKKVFEVTEYLGIQRECNLFKITL
jgi:hypothetical protein